MADDDVKPDVKSDAKPDVKPDAKLDQTWIVYVDSDGKRHRVTTETYEAL